MITLLGLRITVFLLPKWITVFLLPKWDALEEEDFEERLQEALEDYRQSLSVERRLLLDRYKLEDMALKVVGIGSVGTMCVVLFL